MGIFADLDKIRVYSLTSEPDYQVRHYLVIGDVDTWVPDAFLTATYDCPTDKVNAAAIICKQSTGVGREVIKARIKELGATEITA